MTWMWKLNFFGVLILTFAPALSSHSSKTVSGGPITKFEFTQPTYNASVAENSVASTLVIPTEKMGIWNSDGVIKFRIVSGDPFRLFRVEARQVGNFCFLNIRVHSNERILNREFKDSYKVQVRATLYSSSVIENETNSLGGGLSELKGPLSEKNSPSEELIPVQQPPSQSHGKSESADHRTTTPRTPPSESKELLPDLFPPSTVLESKSKKHLDQSGSSDGDGLGRSSTERNDGGQNEFLFRVTRANNFRRKSKIKINGSRSTNSSNPLVPSSRRAVRRSSRDERKSSKTRDKNKSGEKRKNRKEKHLTASVEMKVFSSTPPVPSTITAGLPAMTAIPSSKKKPALVPLLETETLVYIGILDMEDNVPVLEQLVYDIGVSEDAPVLSKVARISAADADIGRNQEIYYSVTEWNDYWSVDPITGILAPIHPLTGISKERQQMRIRARNRFSSGLASESTAQVNIHIRPANRHTPQISTNRLHKVEWRPYGVIYAIVSVRDPDEGENGTVDLKIREGDPNGVFRVTPTMSRNEFYIEMSPIVAKNLNFNGLKPNFFNLTLRASDRGEPSKSSEKELEIKVVDESGSSNAPIFDKDLYEVEISETAAPHSAVLRLKRPDPKVSLSISSGNEGEEFVLEKSGVLYTSRWLDAEAKSTYTLTVDSLDLRPGRIDQIRRHSSVVKILIKVLDANDNDPIFDFLPKSDVFLMENEPIGTKVIKVTARDRDQGENGYVTYNIANLKPVPFSIDHFSGEIKTTEVLDFETSRRRFHLLIFASDWGQPSRREAQTTVTVAIQNRPDNRPLFTVDNCVAVIDRSIKFETEFGKVGAVDFDRNDIIAFRIVGGNEDGCFGLDSVSGRFRVMCDLKDLRVSKRYLNVTATDGEYYSDVMTIKIELRDTLRTNFNKSDTLRSGVKLYSTSQSVFECQDTGIQERFERVAALYEENNKLYENDEDENGFSVLPSRFGENIHPPEFVDFPNEITVNESAEVGSVVFKISARDMDKGYNGIMSFVISNGDESHGAWDIVNVEKSTGSGETIQEAHLVVAAPLDREEFMSYNLNITVWDQGKPPKCVSKFLLIHVSDTNDCAPRFYKSTLKVKIGEGSQLVGETILQVKAYDEDEEGTPNSIISYRLLSETPEFKIDEKTGEIKLLNDLDRERQDSYELFVIAEDHGTPRKLSSMAVLTIQVEDRNDCKPEFENFGPNARIVKIREDWPIGAVVTRVFAKDKDLGLAGLVQYTLMDGSKGDFVLDEISGVLRVRKALDYQTVSSIYNLTIRARDSGSPSLWSETFIVVEIYEVEEIEPPLTFSDLVTVASIEEGSPVGTIITQVTLSSFPQLSYSGVQYSIQDHSKFLFNIDDTGTIRTSHVLDYEVQSSHWLTIVGRSSNNFNNVGRTEVFVQVIDRNDCYPLTDSAEYSVEVPENTKSDILVVQIKAFDCDDNGGITFAIKGTTAFFVIHPIYGEIRTTSVPLDRELQAQHIFDVTVTDAGFPPLSSTSKVTIQVSDVNDVTPAFFALGAVHNIPEMGIDLQGDEPQHAENLVDVEQDGFLKWSDWQALGLGETSPQSVGWRKLHRVVAFDPDAGVNGSLCYRLKYQINTGDIVHESHLFSIHPITGEIYTTAVTLKSDTMLKFIVEASDSGTPLPLKTENILILRVRAVKRIPSELPSILTPATHEISLTTRETPGYTVETIEALDPDGDPLWYEIVSGDPELNFIMYTDSGNVVLARPVTHAKIFTLNISVSDGFNHVFTELIVNVIESEHISSLVWNQNSYTAWIAEATNNSLIATVHINETLNSTWTDEYSRVLYGFHNAQDIRSLKLFNIDILSGEVTIANQGQIDRETLPKHVITVKARDPFNSYIFVRLVINIMDSNDHAPFFPFNTYGANGRTEIRIAETTAVGSTLVQVQAFDMDFGQNGQISYMITFGNIGNTFGIDENSGLLFLNRALSIPYGETSLEYQLTVKATDDGTPLSLSTSTSVAVIVSLPSDGDVLKLNCENGEEKEIRANLKENSAPGTFVAAIHAVNSESVSFEIERNKDNLFWIDPVTGTILVGKNKGLLDRELRTSFDILVKATNSRGHSATCPVFIQLVDVNDNEPRFTSVFYDGQISENAALGSLVMRASNESDLRTPLVLYSMDDDSGINAVVSYSFVEDEEMRTVFHIDPSTGALLLVTPLDYEKRTHYLFHVRAIDGGGLMSSNIAEVNVKVINVNDRPPFIQNERVHVLVPTANGVFVHAMKATDVENDVLTFSITSGNDNNAFSIDPASGRIVVNHAENLTVGTHMLEVGVSDGKFKVFGVLGVKVEQLLMNPLFAFRNQSFTANVVENSTKVLSLLSLSVVGSYMNENLQFAILNPTPFFEIISTSGVIFTTGKKLDREHQAKHNLLIEVRGDGHARIARCKVIISVIDVNDECPIFLNLPYIAILVLDSKPGDTVFQVKAFDADENENAVIRYELARSPFGDMYELSKQTGEILLRRKADSIGTHEIVIKAYDGGIPTCTTQTSVIIKITAIDQPVFEQQWYQTWIQENAEIYTTVIQVQADTKNPVLYSIETGNESDQFCVDSQTGVISVSGPLDYETSSSSRLTIKATDLVTSSWSTTIVNIEITDSNDLAPKFEQSVYIIKVIEGEVAPHGVIGVVKASDNDTGLNSQLNYQIVSDNYSSCKPREHQSIFGKQNYLLESEANDATKNNKSTLHVSKWFMIGPNDGSIVLKKALDYEVFHEFRFSVVVRDSGIPSLSSTARVVIEVVDVNSHPPKFLHQLYTVRVSETAKRGSFVTKLTAYDIDASDSIQYSIVGLYETGIVFNMNGDTGVVTLAEPSALMKHLSFSLNISATDGVFTSYTRLHVEVDPQNHFSPHLGISRFSGEIPSFSSLIYEVGCPENSPNGYVVASIKGVDPDRSIYGKIKYSLADTDEPGLFVIDENSGEVRLVSTMNTSLDREYKGSHTLQILAQDGGGWLGYTKLVVKVGDVNEFEPQFPVSEYRITIPADRLRSRLPIYQIVAIDADTEFSIRYSFVEIPSVNFTGRTDSNYFEINAETGEIRLKLLDDDLTKFEKDGGSFQLWARATDEGGLHSHVPITVVILPAGTPTPEIQPQNATFFVKEDATVGSIVTTFRVTNIEHPRFRVVSSNEGFFQVDQNGNLLVNARLDHEQEDKHTVVVWAESVNGMSIATSQVTVRVLDINDNRPQFYASEYYIKVAEDFPEGSLVFTAHALDPDRTGNIKVRYSLSPEDPPINRYHFAVNEEHGWITLINQLDYESNSNHLLHVIATDSEKPYLMSTASVIIKVLNANDNPPKFESSHYFSEVKEDVAEGTLVKRVYASDKDSAKGTESITPSYLAYYIIKGNDDGHFKINNDGEISVVRQLDCETQHTFKLQLLATDGRYIDHSNLTIKVLDVNDNQPVCPIPEYYHEVPESIASGTYIISTEAQDPDFSAEGVLFSLSGIGADDFKIEPDSGIVSALLPLDRENKFSIYHLTVHAYDRETDCGCSCRLVIKVIDENDNPPRFTEDLYRFFVREDAPIRALVGKVNAIDEDFGVNRKLKYELLSTVTSSESISDQFIVNPSSGIISLVRPLDREMVSEYNLTVKATDGGIPALATFTMVTVTVTDVNDNPPEFAFKAYSVSISELASPLTEVARVLATSKDDGINADITYDIVGGNSYHHFGIHRKTGVIFVNATLDFERVREYVLTVRARDGGQPPLAAQTSVNISLQDMNDNSPLFPQNLYSIQIPEDLPIASSIIKVTAADLDNGQNSHIMYQLGNGDRMNSFKIDSVTGVISVASALDREMIPYYTLEVWAMDHGVPVLSTSTTIEISLMDVNDNPPIFTKENYTAVVQEDRMIGYTVLTFEVSDVDAHPNGAPFSWDLRDLDSAKGTPLPFTVSDFPCISVAGRQHLVISNTTLKGAENNGYGECDNRTHGTLNVAGKLNYQRKNFYRLQVRVFDNGDPPLYSDANITVKVVDKSQWPPVVSALSVTAITSEETYPAGIPLGRVYASDFDPYDILIYSLLKTPSSTHFTIDPYNGTLKSLIPLREGTYELGISVSDGRWTARGDAYVKIVALASILPDIQLELGQAEYLPPTVGKLRSATTRRDISSFAIVMTLRGHTPQSLLGRIFALINAVKEAMNADPTALPGYEVVILSIQSSQIQPDDTETSTMKKSRRKRESDVPSVDVLIAVRKLNDGTLVSPFELVKRLRFAIPQIEAVLSSKVIQLTNDICKENSCERGQCRTGATFEGTLSLISTETLSLITPHHHLETFCSCASGYGGARCEKVVNACAHSECSVGSICVPDNSVKAYSCLCRKGNCLPGVNCDDQCAQQAVSFSGSSFLAYNVGATLERELSISFRIKTLYTSGTLFHTFGLFDYAILEVKQGLVQFSWDLGTGKEVLTVTSISVSDNRWHQILLQLSDSQAVLKVDERSTQRQKSQGPARSLHTGGVIFVGARLIGSSGASIDTLIPSQGFNGCMKDLRYGFTNDNFSNGKKNDMQMQEVKHYITPGLENRLDTKLIGIGNADIEDEESLESNNNSVGTATMHSLPLHISYKNKGGSNLIWSRNISYSCERVSHIVEACRDQPCHNGGTCTEDRATNGYTCECPSRFHGINCGIDRDPCVSSPCLNGGKCSPRSSASISFSPSLANAVDHQEPQFFCNCVDGTFGSRCERGRFCRNSDSLSESEVCSHRGECEDGPTGPICWCEKGYTGVTCQLDVNECERGDACGAGSSCVNYLGGFRCLCPANATGVRCNRILAAPAYVTTDYQIIILVAIVFFAIIFLLIAIVLIRRCCVNRRRNLQPNIIPLTSSHVKDKDNRTSTGRDNRDQRLRNRDSKISNLEVRPVSAGSDIFPSDIRGPVDAIKMYGSVGDDLEKPQFINNLMKEKRKCGTVVWESNRDDYPKIQNYMKGEISWGSKGSNPNSPISASAALGGFNLDHSDVTQSANISPTRTLPPPDVPDSASSVSHDSNSEVDAAKCSASAPISQEDTQCRETLLEKSPGTLEPICTESPWAIRKPRQYKYTQDTSPGISNDEAAKASRSRYPKKNRSNVIAGDVSDDEINENSQLLGTPGATRVFPQVTVPILEFNHDQVEPKNPLASSGAHSQSPQKRFRPRTISSENSSVSNNNPNKKNYSKTTHITQV